MNILHLSDLHFGPRHWDGDDQVLLDKINSYNADIVINAGDNTTDGLENEYAEAGRFLKAIKCKNSPPSVIMTKEICDPMNYSRNIFTTLS